MTLKGRTSEAKFRRARHLPDIELVTAAYRNRQFPAHQHSEFVVGAITRGAETLTVGKESFVAEQGTVLRLHPNQVHSNATIGDAMLGYEVLYISVATLENLLESPADGSLGFGTTLVADPTLFTLVRNAHATLGSCQVDRLEQDSALAGLIDALRPSIDVRPNRVAPAVAKSIQDFLEAHLLDEFGLVDLSRHVGISPFHLIRIFKQSFGFSPLAYRNQRRIEVARERLILGESPLDVAIAMGFADQSHFIRQFQRIMGTSPGRYAKEVRERG